MARTPRHRHPAIVVATVAALAATAGCGAGERSAGGCGPVVREPLDPASQVHVLGPDDVELRTNPPTSGPHQPGPELRGVLEEPIAPPTQVGILERGGVLLQHDPALSGAALRDLRALAGEEVVVAPNPDLPAAVVATAWLFKQRCSTVDPPALQAFVDDHVGRGPEG